MGKPEKLIFTLSDLILDDHVLPMPMDSSQLSLHNLFDPFYDHENPKQSSPEFIRAFIVQYFVEVPKGSLPILDCADVAAYATHEDLAS